jgi:hypothetical protein
VRVERETPSFEATQQGRRCLWINVEIEAVQNEIYHYHVHPSDTHGRWCPRVCSGGSRIDPRGGLLSYGYKFFLNQTKNIIDV